MIPIDRTLEKECSSIGIFYTLTFRGSWVKDHFQRGLLGVNLTFRMHFPLFPRACDKVKNQPFSDSFSP